MFGDGGRNPKGFDLAVGDGATIEKEGIGGDDEGVEGLGLANEFGVGDVLGPESFATGGAEPAREAAEASIADEAREGDGMGMSPLLEGVDFASKFNVHAREAAAEIQILAGGMMMGPGEED